MIAASRISPLDTKRIQGKKEKKKEKRDGVRVTGFSDVSLDGLQWRFFQ